MLPCVPACRISAGNIEPGRIVQRAGVIADRDHLEAELMQLQRRIGADIAEALDHGGGGAEVDRQARSARAWRDARRRARWLRAGPACRPTTPACR